MATLVFPQIIFGQWHSPKPFQQKSMYGSKRKKRTNRTQILATKIKWRYFCIFKRILTYAFYADLIKVTPYRISVMLIIRSRIFVKLFCHRMMHYWVINLWSHDVLSLLASSVAGLSLSFLFESRIRSNLSINSVDSTLWKHLAGIIQSYRWQLFSNYLVIMF